MFLFFLVFNHRSESVTAFDEQSSSLIKLNNNTVLYLREVNKFLALVCILREYSFSRQGVIDFNFLCFRDAIHKVFEIRTIKKCALEEDYDEEDTEHDDDEDDDEQDDELGRGIYLLFEFMFVDFILKKSIFMISFHFR